MISSHSSQTIATTHTMRTPRFLGYRPRMAALMLLADFAVQFLHLYGRKVLTKSDSPGAVFYSQERATLETMALPIHPELNEKQIEVSGRRVFDVQKAQDSGLSYYRVFGKTAHFH